MLYCLSLYAQLTISYMLCTYWLSGKAGQDNVWLEVMTYEPRSVISYHFLMVAELNGLLTNWMTHYLMAQKTELLSIEWFTLTIQGATAHWMPSRTRGAWFVLGASLSQTRFFLKFGSVTVSRVFPCYVCSRTLVFSVSPLELAREWGKSHGTLFWLVRGPKIDSCSRQKIFIQS